jgi:hypothetical protein
MTYITDRSSGYSHPTHSTGTIVNRDSYEHFEKHSGPRESCETNICVKDYTTGNEGPCANNITRHCLEQCFVDKAEQISNCCASSCPVHSIGRQACLDACNTPLVYGGEAVPHWACKEEDGECTCIESESGKYPTKRACQQPCADSCNSKPQSQNCIIM